MYSFYSLDGRCVFVALFLCLRVHRKWGLKFFGVNKELFPLGGVKNFKKMFDK
jgi:hypothetical protein